MVVFFGVTWLPPEDRWESGVLPYSILLPAQILLIVLMAKICADFTRRRGFFVHPRRFFAGPWLWFGWIYLAIMLLRWPLQALFAPNSAIIPIPFHWVLASFVIAVGLWHRRRLRA